jgi:REP element-mobilizing transposase RayT
MSRSLRHVQPNSVVEVTIKTTQDRLLLRPSRKLNELVLGVLGRALAHYGGVRLFAFVVMSNHMHLLLQVADAQALSRFMGFVNGNIGRKVGKLHGWSNGLWKDRFTSIEVLDDAALERRLRYLLSQGVKEGFVARVEHWPGASSTPALLRGRKLYGRWIDESARGRARRKGKKVRTDDFVTNYEVPLAPLPCWAGLSEAERRARVAELVRGVEAEGRELNRELGRKPMGAAWVRRQHPHDMPESVSSSPPPPCHTSDPELRRRYLEARREFVEAYYRAAEALRRGELDVAFPPGCFPPALPFVPFPPGCAP